MNFTLQPGPRQIAWTVTPPPPTALGSGPGQVLTVVSEPRPVITATLFQGRPGAQGPAGSEVATYTVGATPINGHKLLALASDGGVQHADIADPSAPFLFVGMTEDAAQPGAAVQVRRFGAINYLGWDWEDGLVYLGEEGNPTQAPPDGAISFAVGFGAGPVLYLNPQIPVFPPL